MNSQNIELEGKIATKKINQDVCIIHIGNDTINFKLPNSKKLKYDIVSWMNTKDYILSVENHQSLKGATTNSNIVLLDMKGNLIEKIHESSMGEYVGITYSSPNDSLLLLTTRYDNKEHVDNIFYNPISLNIVDFKKKEVIKCWENFCPRINFEIVESPWSPDNNYFAYSIFNKRKMKTKGDEGEIRFKPADGIYIYSIEKDSHTKITEEGHYAIWSPKGDYIAYLNEDEIWLHNLHDSSNVLFYKSELYERIKDIHWTPDGEYLFVTCPKYYMNNNMNYSYNEKLINIISKKTVEFNKLSKGLCWYTWKK